MNPDQLHVLLIGIDAYDGGGSLLGCVNDIDAVQGILLDGLGVPAERVTRLASPRSGAVHDTRIAGRVPTLAAITQELERLASDEVGPHERVFIYYSGHGTQLVLEDDEGRRFPREGLLPKDKVLGPETRVLADWELNAALTRICARCLSATIVLDCCSSAGATRSLGPDGGTTRFWPTPGVRRAPQEAAVMAAAPRGVAEGLAARLGHCQVVAACRANERAREADLGGGVMGHLTRSLCEQLGAAGPAALPELKWGRIWRQIEAAVVDRSPRQRPWLSGGFGRAVFGGDPGDGGDAGFAVTPHNGGYRLDAGTLAGVTENARIGVYGPDPSVFPPLGSPADRAARVGELRIESATAAASTGTALTPMILPDAARGRLVAPGAETRLTVAFQPAADETAARALRGSPFAQVVDDVRHADLTICREGEDWFLTDEIFGFDPEGPRFPPVSSRFPGLLRPAVEHYYRYRAPQRLAAACRDLPTLLGLALLDCNRARLGEADAQTAALPEVTGTERARYEVLDGDQVAIAVYNRSDLDLHVTLIDAAPSGRVLLLGASQVPAHGRERFWRASRLGTPFPASLPPGQPVGVDRLVAIGTTAPGVDLSHLAQETGFADLIRVVRGPGRRDLGPAPAPAPAPVEQYTSASADLWVRRRRQT